MDDIAGKEALDGFLEHVFLRAAMYLQLIGNAASKFDKGMIEKRDAAFNRSRHAHLILFHQQFDQVSLLIGVEHAGENRIVRMSVPIFPVVFIYISMAVPREHELLIS